MISATIFKKDAKGAFVPMGSLKFNRNRFEFGIRLTPEDFPKQEIAQPQALMK